jgi:hypothetical protein
MKVGEIVDNRTLCELHDVANMGGIRGSHRRNHIVLVSNNNDPTYRNEWRGDELHFVGMGSVGPQTLSRQNKTLANSGRRGYKLHLFEVFEKGRYTYAGEVELAGEPYLSDQPDARKHDRFVWIFPLRKKPIMTHERPQRSRAPMDYLPHGGYAIIKDDLTDEQRALVDETLDKLKEAGVPVFDQHDVDDRRYQRELDRWHDAVLDRVRLKIKELIAKRKRTAKAAGREFKLIDDELRINSASTEAELRAALMFLDYDDPELQEQIFEEARQSVPFPEPSRPVSEPEVSISRLQKPKWLKERDANRFKDFT